MIYFFIGNTPNPIKAELQKWKKKFLEKFGDFNFFHIQEGSGTSITTIQEILTSRSFLGDKKLIFFELSNTKTEDDEKKRDTSTDSFIMSILHSIPEDIIVVFYTYSFTEKNALHKRISEIGEVKRFFIQEDESGAVGYILQKYPNLGKREVEAIVRMKAGNLEKSLREIEKLLIFSAFPTIQDIQTNIVPDHDENIFQLTNAIFQLQTKEIDISYKKIKEQINFYYFYNSLLGTLRTVLFIENLKKKRVPSSKIETSLKLGKRSFLVQKKYQLDINKLEKLYITLITFDRKMKTGYTVGNQEDELFQELQVEIYKTIF